MKKYSYSVFLAILFLSNITKAEEHLRLATTTSTDNTGLLSTLNPVFEKENNVKVDVIAVGTGKALRLAQNGDVDLVLVHAPEAEQVFMKSGYGMEREPVMHNDFVLLGPVDDPAGLKQTHSLQLAMQAIAHSKALFISRGDDSGTDKKEKALWRAASIAPRGKWYLVVGQGMGAVLNITDDKQAYTLSDRGTYLAYKDRITLAIVYEGDKELINPYHVILVNPGKYPNVKYELAKKYSEFIRSEEGQNIIGSFRVNGKQLFHPDVKPSGE